MAFFTKKNIFYVLAKMILNESCSLHLKTKLSSEAHDKSCEIFKQPLITAFAEKCILTDFFIILFWQSTAAKP